MESKEIELTSSNFEDRINKAIDGVKEENNKKEKIEEAIHVFDKGMEFIREDMKVKIAPSGLNFLNNLNSDSYKHFSEIVDRFNRLPRFYDVIVEEKEKLSGEEKKELNELFTDLTLKAKETQFRVYALNKILSVKIENYIPLNILSIKC